MQKSSIEWTGITWGPVTGCLKWSAGCINCYAETMSKWLKNMGLPKYKNEFKPTLHPDELETPFTWKTPQLVFVCSMSDLFQKYVPDDFIKKVFEVMNQTPQHTYQVLTKRPERALSLGNELVWTKNIWMGTSIEDSRVQHRLTTLKKIKAKTRFLSLEPLIGPFSDLSLSKIDWVIAGGESGWKARYIDPQWVKSIYKQCKLSKTAFFFKQWGVAEHNPNPDDPTIEKAHPLHAKGGCQLGGKVYREMPEFKK